MRIEVITAIAVSIFGVIILAAVIWSVKQLINDLKNKKK